MGGYWYDLSKIVKEIMESNNYEAKLDAAVNDLIARYTEEQILDIQRRYADVPLDILVAKNITDRIIYNLDIGFIE